MSFRFGASLHQGEIGMSRRAQAKVGVGTAALASSMVPRSLDDRARMADRVVFAQVVSSRTENQGKFTRVNLRSRYGVRADTEHLDKRELV